MVIIVSLEHSNICSEAMKVIGVFLLVATTGLPLSSAQSFLDCSVISQELGTRPIAPTTSEINKIHVSI